MNQKEKEGYSEEKKRKNPDEFPFHVRKSSTLEGEKRKSGRTLPLYRPRQMPVNNLDSFAWLAIFCAGGIIFGIILKLFCIFSQLQRKKLIVVP